MPCYHGPDRRDTNRVGTKLQSLQNPTMWPSRAPLKNLLRVSWVEHLGADCCIAESLRMPQPDKGGSAARESLPAAGSGCPIAIGSPTAIFSATPARATIEAPRPRSPPPEPCRRVGDRQALLTPFCVTLLYVYPATVATPSAAWQVPP